MLNKTGKSKTQKRPLPPTPRRLATPKKRFQPGQVSGEIGTSPPEPVQANPQANPAREAAFGPALIRATYADLIRDARAAAPDGEGSLITIFAPPRHGKSTFAHVLLDDSLDRGQLVLIHDPKVPAQYEGLEMRDTSIESAARAKPAQNTARRYGAEIDPDAVILLGLDFVRKHRVPTTVMIDEGRQLLPKRQSWSGPGAPAAYCEGSSQGLTLIVGMQIPQRAPLECFDYSQAIILGRQPWRTLGYMDQKLGLEPELSAVLPTLKVGEFVLVVPVLDWNRTIYYSPKQ